MKFSATIIARPRSAGLALASGLFIFASAAQDSYPPMFVRPDPAALEPVWPQEVPPGIDQPPPTPTTQIGGLWVNIGPAPTVNAQVSIPPSNQVCGAIQAIAAHPTDANVLYIASVNGGVWRTANATAAAPAWTPLMDTQASLSMGALEFDLADGTYQTLVAGSARISSFGAVGGARLGVLRTTDGGNTWTRLGAGTFANENLLSVAARGSVILAGSDSQWGGGSGSGIFRSTDTGASFTLVSGAGGTGLPAGPVSDIVADPGNLNRFYAAVRTVGIFRTDDAGATWSNVTAGITGISSTTVKIEMAVHNSAGSNVVYVGIVGSGNTLAGVWRSANQGGAWTAMDVPIIHNGSQGNLHFSICADRSNPAVMYIAGDRIASSPFTGIIFRGDASLAPGSQFTTIVNGNAGSTAPHADSRELVADANGNLIESDDGGVYRRTSPLSNAGTWGSVVGNLATVEAHDVAYDSVAKVAMAGTQDNGTHLQSLNGSSVWLFISGGDGGDVAIDDKSTAGQSVRYGSSQNLGGFYRKTYNAANTLLSTVTPALTLLGGSAAITVQFTTPVELNKVNPVRLIIGGGNSAYESLDRGDSVTALAPGFSVNGTFTAKPIAYGGWLAGTPNPDVLYYGSGSSVRVRTTAGGPVAATATAFPGGTIQDLVLDTNDWRRVFVIDSASVYYSTNVGTNWINITGNLTGVGTVRSLEFLGFQGTDCVVAGTDTGVYCSFVNDLGNWSKFGVGLPNTPVYDLTFSGVDNVLVAGTMGRSVFVLNLVAGSSGLSIGNATVAEGNAGVTNLDFRVTLTPATTNTVSVSYATANGSATAGSDYLATNGVLVFLPGETNKTVTVQVLGDTVPEGNETVLVNLSAPTNAFVLAGTGTGTIVNDDAPPTLSIAAASVTEGNVGTTGAVFLVTLSGPSGSTVTANFTTSNGSALAGGDYLATNGVLSIPAGLTSTSLTVRVVGDLAVEPDETFTLTLSALVNATLGAGSATGTIVNDDGLPGQIDHFTWSAIASPQSVSVPFVIVLTAQDFFNATATNFTGPASLSAGVLGGGTLFQADFETGLQGFTVTNALGNGNGLWHLSTGRGANAGHSASTSLYYGEGEGEGGGGTYDTGGINEGAVVSPLISLVGAAAPVSLEFNYLLQTEGNASFDVALVEISTNNGASFFTVASANTAGPLTNNTAGAWLHATVDLSAYAGSQLFLRFHFNTVDSVANTFEGWYVDDITILSAQASPAITPIVTGAFTNGVWAGNLSVLQAAVNAFLRANDNNGHVSTSGVFNVTIANDLTVTMTAAPNPVLAGGALTYTLTVANSGPSAATGVTLTNVLPASVTNVVVTMSQGSSNLLGNVVACNLGTINAGSNATVTIAVMPLLAGSITNQAVISRTGPDGNPANNSATAITLVSVPALTINNASVVEGNSGTTNLALTVTLLPPPLLPASVQFTTANQSATAGVDYLATNGTLVFAIGQSNGVILVPVIGDTLLESNETFLVTLSNPTNATLNLAQAVATILNDDLPPPIVAAGFAVTADACNGNGFVDPGEFVTLAFAVSNVTANVTVSNLTATLLAAGGVLAPSGPQAYGLLAPGATRTNTFSFRANAICGGVITPTLQLQDGANDLGTVAYTVMVGAAGTNTVTFTNSTAITIPDSGAATPYPSAITVSGLGGTLRKVTAKLTGISHTWPDDIDVLLVGPGGQKVMLMSDTGGSLGLTGVTLTFDDTAASALPDAAQITSGTYRATDFEIGDVLAFPAPAGPYVTNLFVFTNSSPNGTWQLFVFDDAGGDQGSIAAGWELALTVTTSGGGCCQSPLEFAGPFLHTNGVFAAGVFVSPNFNYQIQASTNLLDWLAITNLASPSAYLLFLDPAAGDFPMRFYRGLSQ